MALLVHRGWLGYSHIASSPLNGYSRHLVLGFRASGGSLYLITTPYKQDKNKVHHMTWPTFMDNFDGLPVGASWLSCVHS